MKIVCSCFLFIFLTSCSKTLLSNPYNPQQKIDVSGVKHGQVIRLANGKQLIYSKTHGDLVEDNAKNRKIMADVIARERIAKKAKWNKTLQGMTKAMAATSQSINESNRRQSSWANGYNQGLASGNQSYKPFTAPLLSIPSPTSPPLSLSSTSRSPNSYHPKSLANPYGAGSPYKSDGLLNPYSHYGSKYSNKSWNNKYATNAPKLYDSNGKYLGRLSTNKYDPDSISNPYGRYGSRYSTDSINNPYGAGNPYSSSPIYVAPQR